MTRREPEKITWAAPLRPEKLKRLYAADARGVADEELCDEVGTALYARCCTFGHVTRDEVVCPRCGAVFVVGSIAESACPGGCGWETTRELYRQSLKNYDAHTGRAVAAYRAYRRAWPTARGYREKIMLIDQLIHSFHVNERRGPTKSIASKLLEGNKKAVVRFLDELSAIDPAGKEAWRRTMQGTIDAGIVSPPGGEDPR